MKAGRSFSLVFLRPVQYLLDGAFVAVGIALLVRFGLEVYQSPSWDTLGWVVQFRRFTDPLISTVLAGLGQLVPMSDSAAKVLPLGLSIAVWIVRYMVLSQIRKVRLRLEEPSAEAMFGPKKKSDRALDVDLADSEQSREALLKKYRDIEKALKWSIKKRCTFLSIDVVGSTQMKIGKTQTDIAASFQAYEEMLRKLFEKFGAWKQAWTPDGVMVCFLQRDMAVGAAVRTLQALKNFNATENRLGVPFKVRCGLNEGEVPIYDDSKLEKVADHVIDVAGHMQKHAGENALWLSEEVYKELSEKSGFQATDHIVDGYKVYEWALEITAARPAVKIAAAAHASAPVAADPDATLAATASAQSSGHRIGRYEIQEELGRGAMGAVYKALDPQIGRTVALKVILTRDLSPGELTVYKERFYREARAAGKMSHPGIVTVHDIAEDSTGAPFLVMEYVAGRTLDRVAERRDGERMDVPQCLNIAVQVAEALDYAHRQGVVHRDIKPANILITPGGQAKIADFGIAKLMGTQYTQAGQVVGTPAFMAPEQLTGAPVDARTDLFSFGVVLYWMLTGEKPFSGDTITAITYKVVHTMPLPARQLNPALPADLDTVLTRCLSKTSAERYQSAADLITDLKACREGRPLASAPTTA